MISIVLRNRNEAEYIGFALQSISDSVPTAEVIVVDNNSTDDSLDVVNLFTDRLDIKVVKIDDYTPGRAINLGVSQATCDTTLVMSAHSQIIDLDISRVFADLNTYVAVFGKQVPIYRGKKITPRYIWSHFKDGVEINMYSTIEDRQFLHNAFCFYKTDILKEFPIDEKLSGKEDRYWAIDMVAKGYEYLYDPALKVHHHYTGNGATWKGLG